MNIRCGRAGPRSRDDGADESERSCERQVRRERDPSDRVALLFLAAVVGAAARCSPFAPGTPAIPLSQLQQHSLALQGSSGQSITASSSGASQSSQGQQAVFRLPATVSLTGGAMPQQLQTIQVQSSSQSSSISTSDSSPEISQTSTASTATVSLPATIVTSSVPTSMTGHMMYPSPHTVMYASAPTLTDGSLAVLNAFTQGPAAMQVSHTPTQDTGGVPQVFLTAPPGTVQIPVSAVQIHPVRQDQHFTSETLNILSLPSMPLTALTHHGPAMIPQRCMSSKHA
ncbi:Serum response factor [Labeo rohita]|uniref:Serum response factor n=1 Tax=Labeo rohita TaxID=84645 RepID=A0ABQ8M6A4_LABRO|nr:Serum response factor [Labeo rohita]